MRSNAAHTARVTEVAKCRILNAIIDLISPQSGSGSISGTHSAGGHAHAFGGPEAIGFVVRWWPSENHIGIRNRSCGPGVFAISIGCRGGLAVSENYIQIRVLGGCKSWE